MKKLFLLSVLMVGFFVSGCGYSAHSSLPAQYRTIFVENFKNKIDFSSGTTRNIYLPLLEVKVHNAVVSRYQFDGALRIASKEKANLVLEGDLVSYDRQALRYQENNEDVLEYRVTISVNLRMIDTAKKEVLWEESGFSGDATYFISGASASSEASAVEKATTDLARRVVERTIEDW